MLSLPANPTLQSLSRNMEEVASLITAIQDAARLYTPPGIVLPYAGLTAPSGFLMCVGNAVSRETYSDLFAVIGTRYGYGDQLSTFNIPDYRGVFLRGQVHAGTGIYTQLVIGGGDPSLTNSIRFTVSGLSSRAGFKVKILTSDWSELTVGTVYYVSPETSTGNIRYTFSTTYANALAGTVITLASAGVVLTLQQWESPEEASRNQTSKGGSTLGVGTREMDATALPNTAFTLNSDTHSHTIPLGTAAGGGALAKNTVSSGATQATTSDTHTHSFTGGGDFETRPSNVTVNYIIKY